MFRAKNFYRTLRKLMQAESELEYEFSDCMQSEAMREVLPLLNADVLGVTAEEALITARRHKAIADNKVATLDPYEDDSDEPETSQRHWKGISKAWGLVIEMLVDEEPEV